MKRVWKTAFGAEISFPMGEYFSLQQELESRTNGFLHTKTADLKGVKMNWIIYFKLRFTFCEQ